MQKPIFQVKKEETTDSYGRFVIEPLERGYGHTLGAGLRRVLLNSIPGAAITQVKVSGMKHQFSPIKGVKEDGVDLLMNLKQVRISYEGDKPVKLELSARGAGEVRAGDIKASNGVKIANPDFVIAHLGGNSKLDIQMQVESGVGYLLAEDNKTGKVGSIPLDADFSPVKRVAYKIEETRVGRLTNYDKLILEVWTDGSIAPDQALVSSSEILISYLTQIVSPQKSRETAAGTDKASAHPREMNLSVEELNLPTRVANALISGGYETVADILSANKSEIARVRNLGEKSIKIVEAALHEKDVDWKG